MKETIACIWLITILLAVVCAVSSATDAERANAIKAGVAEYRVNPQTGETQFVYKTPKP